MRAECETYFFTVALASLRASTLVDRIGLMRGACRTVLQNRPSATDAIVVLPDHLHAALILLVGNADC
jgi:putative transposase